MLNNRYCISAILILPSTNQTILILTTATHISVFYNCIEESLNLLCNYQILIEQLVIQILNNENYEFRLNVFRDSQ